MKFYQIAGVRREAGFGPFAWRVKLSLLHKGLPFEEETVSFLEKDKIAHAPQQTLPVLEDGANVISDSFKIVEYLEETYPEPSLFGGVVARAQAKALNKYMDSQVLAAIFPHVVLDVLARLDDANAAYFRENREKRIGAKLEDFHQAKGQDVSTIFRALEPFRATLEDYPYLSGHTPFWLDYALMGTFAWAHVVSDKKLLSEDDPVYQWRERMFDQFDGAVRNAPRAVI